MSDIVEIDFDGVICPHCTHQFRAIPVTVQDEQREAAAEIERLRAENATARQEAERLTLHHIELRDAQRRRTERAEAQVAALREALEAIAFARKDRVGPGLSECISIARAALEEK